MQFINPSHQFQLRLADRAWCVVDRASADVKQLGLPRNAEFMFPVDHHLALGNPALVSALSKKSFSSAS